MQSTIRTLVFTTTVAFHSILYYRWCLITCQTGRGLWHALIVGVEVLLKRIDDVGVNPRVYDASEPCARTIYFFADAGAVLILHLECDC